MLPTSSSTTAGNTTDNCAICLSALAPGTPLLTLSCNHKFHLQCLASNIKATNKECPLCRATIEESIVQLLAGSTGPVPQLLQQPPLIAQNPLPPVIIVPSVEDPVDENVVQDHWDRLSSARQIASASRNATSNPSLITTSTAFEYGARLSHEESNIFGLVTLQAPDSVSSAEVDTLLPTRVPIDLVCVVDQSSSMSGDKITLLKQTLVYIVEQMNEFDRLAIISFSTRAFDRSHGLKRMNQLNKQILTHAINTDIISRGGTYIGSGLQMGIRLLGDRQTKNSLSAIFLLTDGRDNDRHDYTQLMQTLPSGVQ
ncbi:unnamed protein product, partial [Rotaria magnacalcarata]